MARFGAGGPSAGFGSRSTGSSSRGSSSRGSSLGDGGGRAANNGGMSASTGSSASSTSNMASPGRSTPGSPNAADGRRGSSMGASGGSARDASNATTNPGRPGGEAEQRALANDISRLQSQRDSLSSELSGIDTQLNDRRQTLSRLSENLQGVETQLGEKRSRLSSLTDNLQGVESQLSTGRDRLSGLNSEIGRIQREANNARNRMVASPNNFRQRKALEQSLEGDNNAMTGLIAPSLEGLENNNSFINNALYGDDTINALADTVRENNNPAIQVGMSPIPGPLSMVKNVAQGVANSFAANDASDTAKDLSVMSGIPLGANTRDLSAGYNAESMSEGLIGGLLGNEQGVRDAVGVQPRALRNPVAMAIPGMDPYGDINVNQQTVDNLAGVSWSPNRENTGGGGGVEEQAPPPEQQPLPPQQRPNSERGRFAGRMTNYGSYRRRFFSRV